MLDRQIESLREWFIQRKRSFPWRENPTPYAVWISEVMLQQTRASVVVDYFTKWMIKFPTISSLANASMAEVLKAWEGLGYYSRARNIKMAAETLDQNGGVIPSDLESLLCIKGIGSYTAGAILSFAFHQKAAAVDGNVSRVVARYFEFKESLVQAKQKKELQNATLSLLPQEEPWVVMEALIELGATVCAKVPKCGECPLSLGCRSYLNGTTGSVPLKNKKKEIIYMHTQVAIIVCDNEVLIEIKREGQVLGGLSEFPSFPFSLESDVESQVAAYLGIPIEWRADLEEERQHFTSYQVDLSPSLFSLSVKVEVPNFLWIKIDELESMTFSSGHKRVLKQLLSLSML